ncbi:hypothetical protein LHYA1_G002929 [Lachnellula hyalina]|uniref:Protein FMP52, mitochondrial n=1 Tax=Lachnellula hyalina TaxID=1316788 RepID=A0A8H8R7X5_9HELO|nr:uncharacterized protein LHYA1_G002929 [Lachnellula hyalina]TVY29256.1 hypothetical protein LHYA1_G002929 [Lachnellula hyalina]
MHLILTGATGLVGSGVLHAMLTTPSVSKISILSRRPVPMAEGHAKAHVIIHKDYTKYPSELMQQLRDADGCVWAQGIKITNTYPLLFARALAASTAPKPVTFIYVSGEGATTSPGRFTPIFGVTKGRTEADLLALSKEAGSNLRAISLRPGGVDPTHHEEIAGFYPQRTGIEGFGGLILPVLRTVYSAMVSPTRDLGRVLTELAMGDGAPLEGKGVEGEGRTVTNVGMRRLAGL